MIPHPHPQRGVALLMVISAIAILSLVLLEFSSTARTHMSAGLNLRDQARAQTMADTSLIMTRACLDQKAWGPLAAMQNKLDLEKLCNLMLGIFIRGTVDLPIGGLSLELQDVTGLGLASGEMEELKLTPEESFIGLAGLYCENPKQYSCRNRIATMKKLRSLLCDPSVAHIFENEQEDGHEYTREEVIGNMIDWIDPDDNRIQIDPLNWNQTQLGTSEGEDSYLRDLDGDHYRSKDAPFDSIEELRLVRGVNDELFAFLKDKVSVHSSGRINVNSASPMIIASLLRAESPTFALVEANVCGEQLEPGGGYEALQAVFLLYANMVVGARSAKQMTRPLAKPFRSEADFIATVKNPLDVIMNSPEGRLLALANPDPTGAVLARYGFPSLELYTAIANEVGAYAGKLKGSITTANNLFRVEARARVGNMTRSVFAVLKREGPIVRTLYYRED